MRIVRYLVVIAALAAMGFGVVGLRARAIRLGYALVREREREWALLEERARLRFELARLKRPDRLFEEAERLNLLPPREGVPLPPSGKRRWFSLSSQPRLSSR